MPADRSTLDELSKTARRLATEGSTDALERLGALVGMDLSKIGSGEGQLDSVMTVLLLPSEQVLGLLPRGLHLAPNPLAPVGKHPVLVQLSHWTFEFGHMDYSEAMLAVPYVQLDSFEAPCRGPFLYMPRLYLNEELPRLLGVYLYGYEKEEAPIERQFPEGSAPGPEGSAPGSYRVGVEGSAALRLAATITPAGRSPARPSAVPGFAAVQQLLEMPTLSQASRIWDEDAATTATPGPLFASNIVYHFGEASASVEPLGVRLTFGPRFSPRGLLGSYDAPPLSDGTVAGGFRLRVKVGVALPGLPATLRYPVTPPTRRQKVVVLGGGPAACAAAYWLARQQDRYEVHVYTQGFRLGGKCAGGHDPEHDLRIEEHGLHAFLGFYENTFRTIRSVYQAAGLPLDLDGKPLGAAFRGSNQNGLMLDPYGTWAYRRTPLDPNTRVPGQVPAEVRADDGDPAMPETHPVVHAVADLVDGSISGLVSGLASGPVSGMGQLVLAALNHALRQTERMEQHHAATSHAIAQRMRERDGGLLARLAGRIRSLGEDLAETWNLSQIVRRIVTYVEGTTVDVLEGWLAEGTAGPLGPLVELIRRYLDRLRVEVDAAPGDVTIWYRWMSLSSVLTAVVGLVEDRVTHLDKLDHRDLWDWFKEHGLDPRLLPRALRDEPVDGGQEQGSPAIMAVYETLFAHGHAPEPRQLAAGVGLRWFLLTAVGYAGYPAWEFKYSCPQTVMTPYYKALVELGAKVHFFHRVTELVVEGQGDDRRLVAIKLQRQATVTAGSDAYDPFLPKPPPQCPTDQPPWPIVPNYAQLVEGDVLRAEGVDLESPYSPWPGVGEVVLERGAGRDFELCVLGIPLGALPPITARLWEPASSSHDPRWTRMLDDIAITRTISMQLWFDVPETELYDVPPDVDGTPGTGRGLLTSFALPEPSMGDLTHVIEWEGWPTSQRPQFLAYHTGSVVAMSVHDLPPVSDTGYPARTDQQWRAQAREWLRDHHAAFYCRAPQTWSGFLAKLSVPSRGLGPNQDPFDAQYLNSGAPPSDHYVLSQPRGMPARMGQMESGAAGLYLCGDWTRTDMNCGCVEAATQSGMLCARGISGHPVFVWHPGF